MSAVTEARKVVDAAFHAADALVSLSDGEIIDGLEVLHAVAPTPDDKGRLLFALFLLESYRRQTPGEGLQVHDTSGGEP